MVFPSRESLIELIKKLRLGGSISIEPHDCSLILERSALNVILSEDSFIKTLFIGNTVDNTLKEGSVVYIDFDTIFSAFLNLIIHTTKNLDNLLILRPDGEDVEKTMAYVCSFSSHYIKLMILDSITTLYYLLNSKAPSDVNRKISVYLSLLQSLAKRFDIPIIVTSMIRAKRVKQAEPWLTSPTGGRALLKSKIVLKLNKISNHIEINVIKHESNAFIGKTFKLPIRLG
ncbi:MAG: hypothetical protein H3Z53_10715 [archaeon]|nr:hypothetical protein [archaeon]MCP8314822.1 hypothetical protein [archaeon]